MKSLFKRYRIDYLLYGGFGSFTVLLLVIVIGMTYSLSANELARNTSYYQQGLLNELYDKLEIQLRSIEQTSLAAARNTVISEYSEGNRDSYESYRKQEEIKLFLASIVYATPIIHSIHYYIKGANVSSEAYPVVLRNEKQAAQEHWFKLAEHTDFAWIGEHRISHYQESIEVISLARKVYSMTGNYQGFLVIHVKASMLKDLLRGQTVGSNRVILDSGGRIITYVGEPLLPEEIKHYLQMIEEEAGNRPSGSSQSGESFSPQSKHFIVWAKPYNASWTLVEHTPWKQITSGSLRTALILSAVGVAAIVVSLFVTLYVSNQFVKPIRLLVHEMGNYTANLKKISLPLDYCNEFGVLFTGYRKLIERIQDLYASLEVQYNKHKKAEIKALQAMINPHFLYNTLDQLNWMAIDAGQDKISHILELMGRMFRIGLSNGESLIRVRDELVHAECYLEIQQLRWGEGLTVTIDVPGEIMDLYIPKMTLQPFIENVIRHGFHDRPTGNLEIRMGVSHTTLSVFIVDDGVGLRRDWDAAPDSNTGGYGIRNVCERYEAFFGSAGKIRLYNTDQTGGTTVHISLPALKNREEAENLSKRLSAG